MRALCLVCAGEFDVNDEVACPGCGDSIHVPANLDDMLTLTISAHELRILTMWADNWAREHGSQDSTMRNMIRVILDRLTVQTDTALTLSQEIADISRLPGIKDVKVFDSSGNELRF